MASQLAVVIVGGGIGGLFAANALIAQGLHVSVYEQASGLGEVGAGVFITPNAVRQLERVGLGPAVERWGARVGTGSQYRRLDVNGRQPGSRAGASGMRAAAHDRLLGSVIERRDEDVGYLLNFAFVFSGAKLIRLHHDRPLRDFGLFHERREVDGRKIQVRQQAEPHDGERAEVKAGDGRKYESMPNGTRNERD